MKSKKANALVRLGMEMRLVHDRFSAAMDELHRGDGLRTGERALVRALAHEGPRTMPALARSRAVSRQHVRALVGELTRVGLVELVANPAHQRSQLVRLTEQGQRCVEAMHGREASALAHAKLDASRASVLKGAEALRAIGAMLSAGSWRRVPARSR